MWNKESFSNYIQLEPILGLKEKVVSFCSTDGKYLRFESQFGKNSDPKSTEIMAQSFAMK